MPLPALLEYPFSAFLVDASGVLYCDDGVIPGASAAIQALRKKGPVFLVTNNSCQNPDSISSSLNVLGIEIAPEDIISSGHGLALDPDIHQLLKQKRVYLFGQESSYAYMEGVDYKLVTADYAQADVIVMTSSLKAASEREYQRLKQVLSQHPRPVVCCNPDQYVKGPQGTWISVVGWYASRLEQELGLAVHWIGKPYANFSSLVKGVLTKRGVTIDSRVCFFDDNPLNVQAMMRDLGIAGCCVTDTGITPLILQTHPKALEAVTYTSPRFSIL